MKKNKKAWAARHKVATAFLILVVLITGFFFFNRGPQPATRADSGDGVYIHKQKAVYSLMRHGQPLLIKGASGYTKLDRMAASGANTIACWDTAVLDRVMEEAEQNKLAVIIGIYVPDPAVEGTYQSEAEDAALLSYCRKLIERYRDREGLLFWCLGNELKFPFTLTNKGFYDSFNKLISLVHELDPKHPVATTIINVNKRNIFNIRWRLPGIDLIGINSYNSLKTLEKDLDFIKLIWNGPYYVSEWAPQGGWEAPVTRWNAPLERNSTDKAAAYGQFFREYMPVKSKRFLGSLAFYWGNRQEYTPTWYSVFSDDNTPTEIAETLQDCWTGVTRPHLSPRLSSIEVDSNPADSNVILILGSRHEAAVKLAMPVATDSLVYQWKILPEAWSDWGTTWSKFERPAALPGLLIDSCGGKASFNAPRKEGAYRLYVTVYNSKNYCATANIPFYVIK